MEIRLAPSAAPKRELVNKYCVKLKSCCLNLKFCFIKYCFVRSLLLLSDIVLACINVICFVTLSIVT